MVVGSHKSEARRTRLACCRDREVRRSTRRNFAVSESYRNAPRVLARGAFCNASACSVHVQRSSLLHGAPLRAQASDCKSYIMWICTSRIVTR